jgi:PST family polysaccharide transporter
VADPEASTERRFRSSLKWAFLMNIGQRGIGMVSTFVIAALLGPRAFGLVAMAMVVVLFMQVFLEQGISTAVIQRESLEREHLDSAFWMTIAWCLLLGGVVVGVSGWWASLNDEPDLEAVTRVLSILLLIQGLTVVQQALLQRRMQFKRLALRSNVAAMVGGVTGIALAATGFGVWALVTQELVIAFVSLALLWSLSGWVPGFRFSRQHARHLLGFSVYAFLGNLGSFVNRRSDTLLIGVFLGSTVVGLYRLADRLVEAIVSATTRPVQSVSLSHFSRLQGDQAALQQAVRSSIRITALTNVPVMFILVACADYLMPMLGPEWVPAADALKLLAIVGIAKALILFTGPLLYALAKPHIRTIMVWGLAAISVGAFAATGAALQGHSIDDQVLWTAAVRAALFTLVFIPINLAIVTHYTNLRLSSLSPEFIAPNMSGLAAVAVVLALTPVLDRIPNAAAFASSIIAAVVTASVVLFLLDPRVRRYAARLWRVIARRQAPVERTVGDAA